MVIFASSATIRLLHGGLERVLLRRTQGWRG